MITESMSVIIFSIVTAMALAILAATTFAFSTSAPAERPVHDTYKMPSATTAVTTIEKNQAWPVVGKKTPHSCTIHLCEDV